MSRVGSYGEDQSEALKRHVILSHTTCRSITRVRLTSDLPVPSAPEIFQSAMWYGITPAWVVLCHTTLLENSKRERSMKGSFPPVVFRNQFKWRWAYNELKRLASLEEETEVLIEERLPKETKRATKSRSGPDAGRERILRSLTERDLQIPHCLPFDELARLPTTKTFLFTHYGGK